MDGLDDEIFQMDEELEALSKNTLSQQKNNFKEKLEVYGRFHTTKPPKIEYKNEPETKFGSKPASTPKEKEITKQYNI